MKGLDEVVATGLTQTNVLPWLNSRELLLLSECSQKWRTLVLDGVFARSVVKHWWNDRVLLESIGIATPSLKSKLFACYVDGTVEILRTCEGLQRFQSVQHLFQATQQDTFGCKSFTELTYDEAESYEYPNEVMEQLESTIQHDSTTASKTTSLKRKRYACTICTGRSPGPFFSIQRALVCGACLDKDVALQVQYGKQESIGESITKWTVREENHQAASDSKQLRDDQFSVCFFSHSSYSVSAEYWILAKGPRDAGVNYSENWWRDEYGSEEDERSCSLSL